MTQGDFNKLPLLLQMGQVMEILGCTKSTLRTLRASRVDIVVKLPGMKQHRYAKAVVAELARLRYQ